MPHLKSNSSNTNANRGKCNNPRRTVFFFIGICSKLFHRADFPFYKFRNIIGLHAKYIVLGMFLRKKEGLGKLSFPIKMTKVQAGIAAIQTSAPKNHPSAIG